MVPCRMDPRTQGRIDPRDVIQEAYLVASQHREDCLRQPTFPFAFWLRGIVGNTLRELHRHRLGTRMRDAGREVPLPGGAVPEARSAAVAARLSGHPTLPGEAALRAEARLLLPAAPDAMDPLDREVLAPRPFELLTPAETSRVPGIEKAAGVRYVRAVKRLKDIPAAAGMIGPRP